MDKLLENKKYLLNALKICDILYKKRMFNSCLKYIEKISYSAWFNFTGYYTLSSLEDKIRKIALETLDFKDQTVEKGEEDKTLHIFSEIWHVGGHSKLMFNWIENDIMSKHYLLSTRQSSQDISNIATTYNYSFNNNLFVYESTLDPIEKAQQIINTLTENHFNRIILHIHPNDVIPSLVFSSDKLKSPVFFMNHAEHTFWLGLPIIDILLQIRKSNIQKDFENRKFPIERQFFLPIPVDESYMTIKKQSKNIFNIISIGSEFKYEPNEEYNFFETCIEIIEKFPQVKVTIIGISIDNPNIKKYQHDRLIFIAPTRNIEKFISSADLYLEGFPVPSFTALLEPALAGVPFVLHYHPASVYKVFDEDKENGIFYPATKKEWLSTVGELITNKKYREKTADKQTNYLKSNFSLKSWVEKLENIKHVTQNSKHNINTILNTENCILGRDEEIVSHISTQEIDHYSFTENLDFLSKLKIVLWSYNTPEWVRIKSLKKTIQYLFDQ